MKRVFEEYGSSVIAVLLATTILMALLAGNGFYGENFAQLLGQVLCFSVEDRAAYENNAFQDYMSNAAITITQREDVLVLENQRISLAEIFEARSCKGEFLPVYLKKAWRLDGKETDLGLAADGGSICVPDAGEYWIELYAVNEEEREASVMLKLLVNER